nr:uncharacterized protein LOC123757568 isoform X2 [Procambarus clarkii]XP_045597278.1 uncharacterized protein LOC123757568 isoform X2 [Procambarus clarkii]
MSTKLFVTCGRGLGTFAAQEIREQVPNVCDIQSLGEGKLSFTINHATGGLQQNIKAREDESNTEGEKATTDDCNKAGDRGKFCSNVKSQEEEEADFVHITSPVFKLKMVERIFMLLHCEQINTAVSSGHSNDIPNEPISDLNMRQNAEEHSIETKVHYSEEMCCVKLQNPEVRSDGKKTLNQDSRSKKIILKEYEKKLMDIVKKCEWANIARRVKALKDFHHYVAGNRVLCKNPNTCPGSLNRKCDKQQLQQKRESALISSNLKKNCQNRSVARKRDFSLNTRDKSYRSNSKRRRLTSSDRVSSIYVSGKRKIMLEHTTSESNSIITENEELDFKDRMLLNISEKNEQLPDRNISLEKEQISINAEYSNNINLQAKEISKLIPAHNNGKPAEVKTSTNATLAPLTGNEITFNVLKSPDLADASLKEISPDQHKKTSDNEETVSFRVSCRVSGPHKTVLTTDWLTTTFVHQLNQVMMSWTKNWREPVMDFYVNITDSHFILGVSLAHKTLSLRHYIPHLTLRSTICYLMARLSQVSPGCVLLDPMCGGGTILLEAATNFEVIHVIGSDLSTEQLEVSRCNLRGLGIPVSLLHADATALPLQSASVNVVLCDFPFGQKHKSAVDITKLLRGVILECQRVLVHGGRGAFLLSRHQHHLLSQAAHMDSTGQAQELLLTVESVHSVSLGETSACLTVLLKNHH